ncbi:unnamed protein product [Blumeria hordei]|uniref:Replication factor C subunit 2 n=1 Tax=Blumeria hordei TaxID=2867405 RepID=A0A383US41_BLUHO|nr:unnamed protein product [Blumeria hordei]
MTSFFDIQARKQAATANRAAVKSTNSKENNHVQPWVEKYRPKSLDDVAAQEHTITILKRTLQSSNLPHMLFYGPPGTGKTSTILALAKGLYGPELYRSRVLELNASDERGISIVRSKIKDFARMQLTQPSAQARNLYPCPPYKIIILDEADSMTQDAQSALRRTMETYSRITRFCLICNYVTRIIDPLASRCSKFRFKMLEVAGAKARLEDIAAQEGLLLEEDTSEMLARCAEGDLRKAITFLQSAARLAGPTSHGDASAMDLDEQPATRLVTLASIEDIAGLVPNSLVSRLVTAMQTNSQHAAYEAVSTVVRDIVHEGWSATQVVSQLYNTIIYDEMIADVRKNQITLVFSLADKRLVDGSDEHLTLLDLALRISSILCH